MIDFEVSLFSAEEFDKLPVSLQERVCSLVGDAPYFIPRDGRLHFWTVARDKRRVVGFHLYEMVLQSKMLDSTITYVTPTYRKRHVARRLWRQSLSAHQPRSVYVVCISPGGRALAERAEREHPSIEFDVRLKLDAQYDLP